MNTNETIAAIATHLSESGISIIRVSGPDALIIGDKIFKGNSTKKVSEYRSHTIHYGFIKDGEEVIDEVILSVMKAPKSYTTEDTIEINCHGGILITKKVLSVVLKNGARLAYPGEFTKRAFLNGRIDLTKAEAIMDVISAENDLALKAGIKQLKGNVYNKLHNMRDILIHETAYIESALDDPEHISLDGYQPLLYEKVDNILNELIKMEQSALNGRIVRDGILTVIVGKPNVGKSSFLNMMLGENRAIVTDIAGTTRDALEESIRINEISLKLVDTAGIRFTKDEVERIGVSKAKEYINDADLVLFIIDSSMPLDENDDEIINLINDKKVIVLLNKNDLRVCVGEEDIIGRMKKQGCNTEDIRFICISAKEKTGIYEFEEIIKKFVLDNNIDSNDEILITNMRHKEKISEAIESLKLVKESIDNNMPEDFLTIDLMNAYEMLGNIIGEEISEDLVNEIFSKFCMGK